MYNLFPFGSIKQGSRIIIFGTGKMGRSFYYQVQATNYARIVGWTDSSIIQGKRKEFPYCNLNQIQEMEYDYIVIGVFSNSIVLTEILPYLISIGIDEKKIIWQIVPEALDESIDNYHHLWQRQKNNCDEKNAHSICSYSKCTGCMACIAACPQKAIKIFRDSLGYDYPFIDDDKCIGCGKCFDTCPQVNSYHYETDNSNIYYAIADKAFEEAGSSGGIFPFIATEYLKDGGVVFGAGFDEKLELKHKGVYSIEQLNPILKSKYVQSKMDGIYDEIKELVTKGEKVLFCGTPCQVAGLKSILRGISYDSLLLVDLFCHGVMSCDMLHKFLDETFGISQIDKIEFRDKEKGWKDSVYTLSVVLRDGTKRTIYKDDNSFIKIFLENWALRDACLQCYYHQMNRCGDITIGDGWNSDWLKGKAKSVVSVNTEKGKAFFDSIKERLTVKETGTYALALNATRLFPCSSEKREHFRNLYTSNRLSVAELYNRVSQTRYDIAIVGGYHWSNYGDEITYYSLYELLRSLGYDVIMSNWSKDSKWWTRRNPLLFKKCPYPQYALMEPKDNISDMVSINKMVKCVVAGSGIYFHPVISENVSHISLLEWVDDDIPKIGYSIAWGVEDLNEYPYSVIKQRTALKRFAAVGVRENSGLDIAKTVLGVENAFKVLDPVLVAPQYVWEKLLVDNNNQNDQKYIFAYILDNMNESVKEMLRICKDKTTMGCKLISRYEKYDEYKDYWSDLISKPYLEEWIECFKKAEYVVTDSFHGLCLCLLFEKQFSIVIGDKEWAATRINGLLSVLGLLDRVISINEDVLLHIDKHIDYKNVSNKLNKLKSDSINWLKDQLMLAIGR